MIYLSEDNTKYGFSYRETREEYIKYCEMSDSEFKKNLKGALHLACFICFIKEIPSYVCLSDRGIIHELIHLLHIPKGNTTTLKEIRKLFEEQLKLA